ncbi:MAG: WD domain-containing protein, G-beta repeat-containing protein [Candidatus Kentron sp. G]|nr:MAG: WD domain-containing protein, G-beta repeat-containing protein [Candidatus Kentron sp. G]VFN03694.1 MAG: WD domain-containing protein, G-beta repeat-containing protein [Candidatus Kentron sp. G]VFN05058.1 MAG: WD domain-containing protein, G-beta repeat-containing protein [Candidatus Kentron sp. G]
MALVYYAGHGIQIGGESYLLPVDVPKDDVELLERRAVALDRKVLRRLDNRAELTIAVFDACREIPESLRAALARSRGGFNPIERGLATVKSRGTGRLIAYSAAAGQVAADGQGTNSPYTTVLLEQLDNNPHQSVEDLFAQAAYDFRQRHGGQQPELLNQGVRPNYYYLKPPIEPPKPAPAPPDDAPDPGFEVTFWNSVHPGRDIDMYRAYLAAYPKGRFVPLAKRMIEKLELERRIDEAHPIPKFSELMEAGIRLTTGQLIVRSNVSGDTVILDGRPVGPTGPSPHQLAPGEYTVRVEKEGYEPFETTIRLPAGGKETVRARLVKPYANWRALWKIKAHPGGDEGAICPHCLHFSPDGGTLLSGSHDDTLKLWNVASGQAIRTLKGHSDNVRSVAFAPDGRAVLSGSNDNTLKLWDVANGEMLRTLKGHSDSVTSVAFAPDGRTALSGSIDKTLKRWNVASGEMLHTFEGHSGPVYSVAFAPDGRTALSGSSDKTLKLWDVANGQEIHIFRGHSNEVMSVAFAPDGRTALSGSIGGNTVRLWDVASGQAIQTLPVHGKPHSSWVWSVAFSPDGRRAASGGYDGTIIVWGEE